MRKRPKKVKTTAALFLFMSCGNGNQQKFLCSSTSTKVLLSFFSFLLFFLVVFLLFAKSRRFHEQDERWRESCFLSVSGGEGVEKGPLQGVCSSFFCLLFSGIFFFLFFSALFSPGGSSLGFKPWRDKSTQRRLLNGGCG